MINRTEIKKAIKTLNQKYGVAGFNGEYMLATDTEGDLRIAPVSILDKILQKRKFYAVNASNFIKVKDLV